MRHLSKAEKARVQALHLQGKGLREVARAVRRSPAAVKRCIEGTARPKPAVLGPQQARSLERHFGKFRKKCEEEARDCSLKNYRSFSLKISSHPLENLSLVFVKPRICIRKFLSFS